MTREPFDLEWLGGVAEHHFRKVRPGVEEMPWGTLDPSRYPAALVDRSRISWTEAAYNEYCTASAFADLIGAMLEAKAPIDLVGMASDFIADEILHVELTSRIAMELGGGAPYTIDFTNLHARPDPALSPLQRANQLVVHVCCVAEAFSLPMLASAFGSATHPLTKAVLERIVKDEAPHGRLGFLWLAWAEDRLDDAERARLAGVTVDTIASLAPLWQRLQSRVTDGLTTEGYRLEHIRELGWTESSLYKERARRAIEDDVLAPLARFGIVPDRSRIAPLVSD
ncbi:MAG: ferritin-like domain-containing protein [Labilithrix sp.]|nr:ferritin-like domain-containing protein [Labilithrix sp.]MCW5816769.1 ferritin-like domain-containing protein [Labilithrix sp.]